MEEWVLWKIREDTINLLKKASNLHNLFESI